MKEKESYKIAIECFAIAFLFMLLCSCASFDVGDWPSRFVSPHNGPAENLCGAIGAFCAYYLLYSIGPGVFVVLVCAIGFIVMKLMRKTISQLLLRSVGLTLLTVAVSSSFYCLWPHQFYQFPFGSGGLLGVAAVTFLQNHFAMIGTFILIASLWIVGIVLLADTIVITALSWFVNRVQRVVSFALAGWLMPSRHFAVFGEIWCKLRMKQKETILEHNTLDIDSDAELESKIKSQKPVTEAHVSQQIKLTATNTNRSVNNYIPKTYDDYILPPLELLDEPEYAFASVQGKVVKAKAAALEGLLIEFGINARVVAADTGPVVTMFELELGAGVKVSQISSLSSDMARALSVGAVRVVAPLPGKHTIGIEVPNSEKEKVRIKDLLRLSGDRPDHMQIPLFLGKDSSGDALVSDLTAMPHILIAGTTGSGKSVCINSIITSILLTKRPDEVKMILVDPKMVEMTAFNTVPHLMSPIVTETKRAVQILEWATVKMDERYAILAEARVKNITGYNRLSREELFERFSPGDADEEAKIPKKLPYIVIIIDELADLMMTAAKEIESYIVRLAQKSRAVGIHIVLATQRPQATVVTGLIKSNMPTRIGFRVAARMDSRIILDQNGAETLLGQGDMLFLKPGTSDLIRAQGTFLDDMEVRRIVKHLKEVAEPQFHPELAQLGRVDVSEMSKDDLFDDAVRIVLGSQRGSVSLLQRRLGVGYARASRMIEMMGASGILGEYKGSQAREVLMTLKEYDRIRENVETDKRAGYKDLADNVENGEEKKYFSEGQKEYISVDNEED